MADRHNPPCAECGHAADAHDDLGCAIPIAGERPIYCGCPWLLVRVAIYPEYEETA
jgi:hypothetical protein